MPRPKPGYKPKHLKDLCTKTWSDGWGIHTCTRDKGHQGRCRCTCDAERWE